MYGVYSWAPLVSPFNYVVADKTVRAVPSYMPAESLSGALDKLVTNIRSAMAVGDIS